MTPCRLGLLLGLAALAALDAPVSATDKLDYLSPHSGTMPVALTGGDTPGTSQVSCSSNTLAAGATLLRAATPAGAGSGTANASTTTRPLRNICFQNAGTIPVQIGSSTVAASDFWVLSGTSAVNQPSTYCTHNSGAYYCAPFTGNTAQNVNVIVETQSNP